MNTFAKVAQSVKAKVAGNKSVKQVIEARDAMQRLYDDTSRFEHRVIHGIPVILHDDRFKATGRQYAMMVKEPFFPAQIYVESSIFGLESDVIKFIVSHEAGHVHLHSNMEQPLATMAKRELKALMGSIAKEELEADQYAAERIGYRESIVAMRKFIEHLASTGAGNRVIGEMSGRLAVLEQEARALGHIK